MLSETKFHIRSTLNLTNIQYPDFPREKYWGNRIIFEIIDQIHGADIIYSIGTNNEITLKEYIQEYLG